MISYLIVGSGYRAEYFGRAARQYPDLFRALFLCRSEEKVRLMREHTGIPATVSLSECLSFQPDFAVVAVDRGHMADVIEEWAGRGFPVVAETPVAADPEQLERIEALGRAGARIVSCEQYPRQPILAAGLREIEAGTIGTPSSLYISLLHDYHAAGLIRRALQIGRDEPYTVTGACQKISAARTDSRTDAFYDGQPQDDERTAAVVRFSSGKLAVYDFASIQYRSYIRSRHLTVRGSRGEWTDTAVLYLDENNQPQRKMLLPVIPEKYRLLDTQALRDKRRNWTAELAPDTVQDEFAVASFLLDMGDYLHGSECPYPLWEALEDARFWMRLQEISR